MKINVVVPLAGPDIVRADGSIKPLTPYRDSVLIQEILKNRSWVKKNKVEDIIFVIQEIAETENLHKQLKTLFPNCKIVRLSNLTRGALMSASAGVAQIANHELPLCVDLVDINYDIDVDIYEYFEKYSDVNGLLFTFKSSNSSFSYVAVENEVCVKFKEKEVISDIASAGTYFYRNSGLFLNSVGWSLLNFEKISFKDNLFLCPSYNFFISMNNKVDVLNVDNVESISEKFHVGDM